MKKYGIRKSVLNLTTDQWGKYKELSGDSDIMVISVASAANNFGHIGMLTAKANSEELEFSNLLYLECNGIDL